MKLIIASNNQGKVLEYKQLLAPLGYKVVSQSEAGIDLDVEETGATFRENASLKARAIYELGGGVPVIADDSGLEVDFLGGEPGVYSARYAPHGQRRKTILAKMETCPPEKRTARFFCCICYIDENGEKFVDGEVHGLIGYENRGDNGFGYDSIFMYKGKSFAELASAEKNNISHRGAALRKLIGVLDGHEQ
ncbi:MAG: RdgB/HAM1 family non-canonical purine NTP pyrophosphatase [Oscillospiraceae bacterium]|nr:RdgB/HAM1 family non-canonical purine NTP pyrophosphatase [Oscillospiraceae bacterium]